MINKNVTWRDLEPTVISQGVILTTLLAPHTTTGMQLTKMELKTNWKIWVFLRNTAVLSLTHTLVIEKHSPTWHAFIFFVTVWVYDHGPMFERVWVKANVIKGIASSVRSYCNGSDRLVSVLRWMCAFLFVFLLIYTRLRDIILVERQLAKFQPAAHSQSTMALRTLELSHTETRYSAPKS